MITIQQERPDSPDAHMLIAELEAYLDPLYPPESRHGLSIEQLVTENVIFFVIRVDGSAAGCVGLKFFDMPESYAEVKRMYVAPQFRGQGLAKKLLDHASDVAMSRHITILRLEAGIYQPEALGLYEKIGFSKVSSFGNYTDDPLSVFYEKSLDDMRS
ncbi:MAG: GNAT family N-acetyltransferase [Deinococcota bacterium]